METQIIDGRFIANKILKRLKTEVKQLRFRPLFCDILVGSDPVSLSFVRIKGKKATEIGLDFRLVGLDADITTAQLITQIEKIESEPNLRGLIVQLPLPGQIDQKKILQSIKKEFDADCLGGKSELIGPTASAIIEILDSLNLDLREKEILVIGRGELVGKPVSKILAERGLNVITADRSTGELSDLTSRADVIISGAGYPNLINSTMIKQGVILIDAGTAESEGGIVGDMNIDSLKEKSITSGARRNASAAKFFLTRKSKPYRRCARGHDYGISGILFGSHLDAKWFLALPARASQRQAGKLHFCNIFIYHLRSKPLSLSYKLLHKLWSHDSFRKAWIILHISSKHQLTSISHSSYN